VEHRDERIVVDTARYRVTGMLRLPREGYRSRLTDYLNAGDRSFVPLTDAEIVPLEGAGAPEHRAYVAVSTAHIVLAAPAESQRGDSPPDG